MKRINIIAITVSTIRPVLPLLIVSRHSLLQKVFGVEEPEKAIAFELPVKLDHTSFIDGYIPSTHVMIEQKSLGKDLRKAHQLNDKAVMEAYGFWGKLNTESECVTELMKMYQKLTAE